MSYVNICDLCNMERARNDLVGKIKRKHPLRATTERLSVCDHCWLEFINFCNGRTATLEKLQQSVESLGQSLINTTKQSKIRSKS
jgi:hypothetical protein